MKKKDFESALADLEEITDYVFKMEEKRYNEWLAEEYAKVLPPDIFLAAYGDLACKQRVSAYLKEEGYEMALHPCGKRELRKGDSVIATWLPNRIIKSTGGEMKEMFWNGDPQWNTGK